MTMRLLSMSVRASTIFSGEFMVTVLAAVWPDEVALPLGLLFIGHVVKVLCKQGFTWFFDTALAAQIRVYKGHTIMGGEGSQNTEIV